MSIGHRRCRGCSPRSIPQSGSPWWEPWSANIWVRRPGLGYLIQQAEGVFDVAGVFAGMFVLAAFVIVIDVVVSTIENRLLVWRPVASESRP